MYRRDSDIQAPVCKLHGDLNQTVGSLPLHSASFRAICFEVVPFHTIQAPISIYIYINAYILHILLFSIYLLYLLNSVSV